MQKLDTLAETVKMTSVTAVVAHYFEKIEKARAHGWTWPEIADSVGMDGKSDSLRAVYSKIKREREVVM